MEMVMNALVILIFFTLIAGFIYFFIGSIMMYRLTKRVTGITPVAVFGVAAIVMSLMIKW